MAAVHEPVEDRASPEELALETCSESAGEAPQSADGDIVKPSCLDRDDDPTRDARQHGKIRLAQLPSDTQPSKRGAEALVIHPSRMSGPAYLAIT